VMRLDTHGARLAFLSACETAQGAWRLPDEAAHIAGALQVAGFTHVLATQWRVADRIAATAARRFYSLLPESLDAGTAAVALNATARYLRDERGLPAICWAPYLHFGP
jgi:CHAT domain-containing protein